MSQLLNCGNYSSNFGMGGASMNGAVGGNIGASLNINVGNVLQSSSAGGLSQYRVPLSEFSNKDKLGAYCIVNDNNYNNSNNSYITSPNVYPRYINQQVSQNQYGYQQFVQSGDLYSRNPGFETIPERIGQPSSGFGQLQSSNRADVKPAAKMVPGGYSNSKGSVSKLSGSGWKEWSSYSKLLPLAVVELDVQNECNYLSSLFASFSNTVKGFISNFEFDKLMEYVNIIEVGYRGTIFGVMDRNQDDYITQVEFLTGMLIFRPYNSREKNSPNFNKLRLQFIFFYYDSNRDGLLSIDELAKLIEHISIIKVTISNKSSKPKKKTQISTEKSRKLASQVIHDYLNKDFCSYDDFFQLVNNGILNGTVNLLRCRNDIFLQKKGHSVVSSPSQASFNRHSSASPIQNLTTHPNQQPFSPPLYSNPQIQSQFLQTSQIPTYSANGNLQTIIPKNHSMYNTPINASTEQFPPPKVISGANDEYLRVIQSKPTHAPILPTSDANHPISASKLKANTLQNQNNTDTFNHCLTGTNLSTSNNNHNLITPSHNSSLFKNNSISSTITRKQEDQFTAYSNSPPNALHTPEPLSNYRSTYESSSPYYNIPSEGRLNLNFSPYQ
ncbi:erythrocyte membrane-associated antigen [Cryptosporidium canis]|uniref:Erythrocyte membrane-associated antigen n=1 Tax=Cryptosporidium canis TaxID=195482 RepID=A0ABQ8P2Q4_9CRYT|nr:erythrocyte membrane-associated antigen [Cryptosporidium canis]